MFENMIQEHKSSYNTLSDRLKTANTYIEEQEHNTTMLVHSTLAQPIVHNEWAGMCCENVLNVVRGVRCVCCAVCCGVLWGSFLSTF